MEANAEALEESRKISFGNPEFVKEDKSMRTIDPESKDQLKGDSKAHSRTVAPRRKTVKFEGD